MDYRIFNVRTCSFLCVRDSNLGSLDLESDALPTEGHITPTQQHMPDHQSQTVTDHQSQNRALFPTNSSCSHLSQNCCDFHTNMQKTINCNQLSNHLELYPCHILTVLLNYLFIYWRLTAQSTTQGPLRAFHSIKTYRSWIQYKTCTFYKGKTYKVFLTGMLFNTRPQWTAGHHLQRAKQTESAILLCR